MSRSTLGAWGEAIACQYLIDRGLRVRARNWRVREGEIDIVAQDGDTIVFVEVKTRSTGAFGYPEEAVTRKKRDRIVCAAWAYLESLGLMHASWRIDVIAIERAASGGLGRLEHYADAIGADLPT